ncbi:alpha-L-arabinofuranosidase C-terminal domain-containing protein [Dinghuibacter silviterrae]|uniref:non-reducing end alpha-L-arabinofuranosidase n=1 Tax=Dinghuibacter silviterrae TaxID=1539049 RepID=A0A4R8DF13_9BACT|nr:alpha-L-arabinofuranosidase C-terminal domain-containing protein [Dinghuibacter silviterrae]TDW95824.1 alpha-N-arabinofuranosidase [Dinghuibacter silviterrae]
MRKYLLPAALALTACKASAQTRLTLHLDTPMVAMSPRLYGLMTEEINFSYEGGLYDELIRNRSFKDSAKTAAFWSLVQTPTSQATMSLDRQHPLNDAMPVSLRLDIAKAGAGVTNQGFWGIPVRPNQVYKGSFYAKYKGASSQPLTLKIESPDGDTVFAQTTVDPIGNDWKQYTFTLKTAGTPSANARFSIRPAGEGTYWFTQVSLFPPTYDDHGLRPDLMQLLAGMKPSFLRFPGGNYVEGWNFSNRWNWKETIGPAEQRPGHLSPWGYRSTDGMGLLEFLEWCEDLHMEPLLAVFAGYTLNTDYLTAGPFLQPFVDDALDEIEYVTGDVHTKWGAQRAKDGHPDPFPLHFVEIGNEDGFDLSGSYEGRYAQFYDAIKTKYPGLQVISTVGGKDWLGGRFPAPAGRTEIVDEHYYRNAWEMEAHAHQYDHYDRSGPKVFVGEWATREGSPTTNFNAALGDAAWMTGMENNADHVIMASYAPLLVRVDPGGMQWRSDLIGYNTLTAYGSPSYYAQALFSNHLGNAIIKTSADNVPTQTKDDKTIDAFFYSATTKNDTVYLKLVNTQSTAQKVVVDITGATWKSATMWTLKADSPTGTNTIDDPQKIVPVETTVKTLNQTLPPYSITVLQFMVQRSARDGRSR